MILFAFIFGYATLLIELIFFHVPSVANTKNFFVQNNDYSMAKSDLIKKVYHWSFLKKILVLLIPTILINVYFLVPFLYFLPNAIDFCLFKPNSWLEILGVLFIVLGRYITFGSMIYIRKENKQTVNSFKLHTSGIFAYSRNPGLDGMFLFFAGFGFIVPTMLLWIGLLFYFYYMLFRVKIEEEFLKALFQNEYENYCQKTKRFLLF
jgi:protein-S-isoprenylcysteine O-methyltransferase Ste14